MPYPVPENEAERNAALRSYGIMDTLPEISFTEIGDLAAQICGCPVSYIAFIEDDRFWIKAKYGLPEDFEGCPREIAFCSVTVCGADLVYSPNLVEDERFRDFHFVVNDPRFRFYCAMPLITPEGYALGTICVMDFEPRELTFEQRETLRRLAHQLVSQLEHRRRLLELDAAHAALAQEKARADDLLARILPDAIADELKAHGKVEPRFVPEATLIFADVKGFTRFTERAEPAALIAMLDRYFACFDEAVGRHGVEKLKTVGDAYLAVAGLPQGDRNHVISACLAGLEMLDVVAKIRAERERLRLPFFELRIGIHSGPVIAGVVGRRRFTYDVWGDAVNVASLMEANSEANRINVSETVYQAAAAYFEFEPRGAVEAKNKGAVPMYFLDRLKRDYARDATGRLANDRLSTHRDLVGLRGIAQ